MIGCLEHEGQRQGSLPTAWPPCCPQVEEEEGDTPNVQAYAPAEEGATPGAGIEPSPEILGYHEQQELATSSHDLPTFALPR